MIFQPILGLIHHMQFRKTQRRTFWARGHVWFGRGLIAIGVVNGGLGLQLAQDTVTGEYGYAAAAGFVFLVYLVVVVVSHMRSRGKKEGETGEKMGQGHENPYPSGENLYRRD